MPKPIKNNSPFYYIRLILLETLRYPVAPPTQTGSQQYFKRKTPMRGTRPKVQVPAQSLGNM